MRARALGFGIAAIGAVGVMGVASARADEPTAQDTTKRTTLGQGTPAEELPPPRSDDDPRPRPAKPDVDPPGVTKQAGVGGTQAYGRAGVLELGGAAGFGGASNYRRFELSPSIGFFVADNFELSLLTSLNYFDLDPDEPGGDGTSATELKAMIEPSYHYPFTDVFYGFAGLGMGFNYLTGYDAGFAWQPRIGANFLVGRSGVLTPSFTMTYSTVEALRTPAGTLLAVQTSYGLNVGYTVMW